MSVELPPLPESDFHDNGDECGHERTYGYDADQMQAYARAAVEAALEAAAVVCDAHDKDRSATGQHADAEHCAAAIRSLKSPISDSAV